MRPQGHAAGGYLTAQVVTHFLPVEGLERVVLLALGTVAGTAPDFDILYYVIKKRSLALGKDLRHHGWISHTMPFHAVPAGVAALIGGLLHEPWIVHAALVYGACSCEHVAQDIFGAADGIMLAWPFSKHMTVVGRVGVFGMAWLDAYKSHPIFWVERCLIFAALLVLVLDAAGVL